MKVPRWLHKHRDAPGAWMLAIQPVLDDLQAAIGNGSQMLSSSTMVQLATTMDAACARCHKQLQALPPEDGPEALLLTGYLEYMAELLRARVRQTGTGQTGTIAQTGTTGQAGSSDSALLITATSMVSRLAGAVACPPEQPTPS